MPSVSPRCSVKLTPSTARTTPASVKNQVCRFIQHASTDAIGSAASRMRIEPVAHAVADEVEADHHGQDGEAGKRRDPPLRSPARAPPTPSIPIRRSAAPRPSPRNDRPANTRMALPRSSVTSTTSGPSAFGTIWRNRMWVGPKPIGLCRCDVFRRTLADHQAARQAGEFRPPHHQHGNHRVARADAERRGDRHRQDDRRKAEHQVGGAHQRLPRPSRAYTQRSRRAACRTSARPAQR